MKRRRKREAKKDKRKGEKRRSKKQRAWNSLLFLLSFQGLREGDETMAVAMAIMTVVEMAITDRSAFFLGCQD